MNLDTLSERFEEGTEVTPELLRERRIVRETRALIKVLARGEISKKLTVRAHKFSAKAREAITAAGGAVEVVPRLAKARAKTKTKTRAAGSETAE